MMLKKTSLLLLILACLPWSSAAAQNSYSSYYKKKTRQPHQNYRGDNVNSYLFDKYYKSNRNVSPYANLNRRGYSGTGYQTQVRPEQQRRAESQSALRQRITQKKQSGHVGHTNYGFAQQLQRGIPDASDVPSVRQPATYYRQFYSQTTTR